LLYLISLVGFVFVFTSSYIPVVFFFLEIARSLCFLESNYGYYVGNTHTIYKRRNSLVQIEELVVRITPTVLDIQLGEQRTKTPTEKSEIILEKWFLKNLCFKIMKFSL